MNEEQFIKALQTINEIAADQGNVISKDQIKEAFDEINFPLTDERFGLIEEYLTKNHIGIDEAVDPFKYMTESEKDYLQEYLDEVAIISQVSDGEKKAITMAALAGEADAKNRLIEIYLPYVAEVAKLYAGWGVYLEDLIGEGNVALAMAAEMLESVEKPEDVEGFFGSQMMEAMESYIKENTDAKKADEKVVAKINKIAEMAKELSEELGRDVTPQELAEENNISLKSINDAMKMTGDKIEGLSKGQTQ